MLRKIERAERIDRLIGRVLLAVFMILLAAWLMLIAVVLTGNAPA